MITQHSNGCFKINLNMKYVIFLGDGMADDPQERLGGKLRLKRRTFPIWIVSRAKARAGCSTPCLAIFRIPPLPICR